MEEINQNTIETIREKILNHNMKRIELSDEKKIKYDAICDQIMKEIEEQNPDQYLRKGQLDGKATQIYQKTYNKYLPYLRALFDE